MSYQQLISGLAKINNVTSWDSLLINYDHKAHPNEYTCYSIHFSKQTMLTDTIEDMSQIFIKKIESFDKKIEPYSGFNSKNTIDKLSVTDPIIKENWHSLIQHINISDDTIPLKDIKAKAFMFVGTYSDNNGDLKNLYLLTRKNPVINLKNRAKIFSARQNTIKSIDEPLVQFSKCFDAIVYEDMLYMINGNCESILNMEYSHKLICNRHLDALVESDIIQDFDLYRTFATSGQTPKKFITYDSNIVDQLTKTAGQQLLEKSFKIPFNQESNKFDLSNPEHAKIFTLIICGKTKSNLLDEGFCEVSHSTPLNLP